MAENQEENELLDDLFDPDELAALDGILKIAELNAIVEKESKEEIKKPKLKQEEENKEEIELNPPSLIETLKLNSIFKTFYSKLSSEKEKIFLSILNNLNLIHGENFWDIKSNPNYVIFTIHYPLINITNSKKF